VKAGICRDCGQYGRKHIRAALAITAASPVRHPWAGDVRLEVDLIPGTDALRPYRDARTRHGRAPMARRRLDQRSTSLSEEVLAGTVLGIASAMWRANRSSVLIRACCLTGESGREQLWPVPWT
jgi:hypothetical protein